MGFVKVVSQIFGGCHEAFCFLLSHRLPFLQHAHELDANQSDLDLLKRIESEHRPSDPLPTAMFLYHKIVEMLHLVVRAGDPMLLVVALVSNGSQTR
jgi:hypothetical protein